jgi:hypothetical protein
VRTGREALRQLAADLERLADENFDEPDSDTTPRARLGRAQQETAKRIRVALGAEHLSPVRNHRQPGGGYRGSLDGAEMQPPADIPTGAVRDTEDSR